jgi:hypothetical protein
LVVLARTVDVFGFDPEAASSAALVLEHDIDVGVVPCHGMPGQVFLAVMFPNHTYPDQDAVFDLVNLGRRSRPMLVEDLLLFNLLLGGPRTWHDARLELTFA